MEKKCKNKHGKHATKIILAMIAMAQTCVQRFEQFCNECKAQVKKKTNTNTVFFYFIKLEKEKNQRSNRPFYFPAVHLMRLAASEYSVLAALGLASKPLYDAAHTIKRCIGRRAEQIGLLFPLL